MADDEEPTVPVVCPACGTETAVPLAEVEAAVTEHNESVHDGAAEARVDPAVTEALADVVADDLGLLED